jgi:hypothetical protein
MLTTFEHREHLQMSELLIQWLKQLILISFTFSSVLYYSVVNVYSGSGHEEQCHARESPSVAFRGH